MSGRILKGAEPMAYSRFYDSDIYIYPSVFGHIECAGCFLNISPDEDSIFKSEHILDDETLLMHILQHRISGHNIPDGLEEQILRDPERYGREEEI
jgi:hypothetical protein